jgi:soluble cytochrome b562
VRLLVQSRLCPDIAALYADKSLSLTEKEKEEIAPFMIENDNAYKTLSERVPITGAEKDKKEHYGTLYIKSRYILSLLQVKEKEAQQGVAHYTTPSMLSTLILNDPSPLRLHLINLSSDPGEGRTLMHYLYDRHIAIEDNGIVALAAGFTFNRDCLNLFRLYGKDDKKETEGAGVSIIVKDSFFESTVKAPSDSRMKFALSKNPTQTVNIISGSETTSATPKVQKEALYRCMYVDPETQQVISLGQREAYTFYRDAITGNESDERKKQIKRQVGKEIKKYRKEMDELVEKVQKAMDDILTIIKEHNLDSNIVAEWLVDLRCLTKHVAFREEQECRIVKVVDYMNDDKVKSTEKHNQLYMDYLPLVTDRDKPDEHYVKAVCFGPHFKYREVYAAELRKLGIPSSRSTHPLA